MAINLKPRTGPTYFETVALPDGKPAIVASNGDGASLLDANNQSTVLDTGHLRIIPTSDAGRPTRITLYISALYPGGILVAENYCSAQPT